jgi:hypothetical protein
MLWLGAAESLVNALFHPIAANLPDSKCSAKYAEDEIRIAFSGFRRISPLVWEVFPLLQRKVLNFLSVSGLFC